MKLFYTAAHGGFGQEHVPLGGGGAVCDMLCQHWRANGHDFELYAPQDRTGRQIIHFQTNEYARFARAFEQASTAAIQQHDPARTAILVNDLAEGPDFAALQQRGYRITTIWHVDVVAYIAAIYCRGLVKPETLVRCHNAVGALYPDILQLIFQKQKDCVRYSAAHIVPSEAMKQTILRCYPDTPPDRIHVLPWGVALPDAAPANRAEARRQLGIPASACVLLTLSRLSPEKNQQLLLKALQTWERQPDYPEIHAVICGGAAFMQGQQHEALLRAEAAKLTRTKVHFPGFVHGQQKQQMFAAADLYVFPSTHESYGLTLMEAFQAGLPAITLANAAMRPEFGAIATPNSFLPALQNLLQQDLPAIGRRAQAFANQWPFAKSAEVLRNIALAALV